MDKFMVWFPEQDVFKNADAFYTELPFFYMTDSIGTGEKKEIPYWMHGESDLVIKLKDGSFHVIDYKSDDDTKFKGEAEFVEYLNKKYTPQIVEYKRAVSSIFGVGEDKVSASLISFSYMDPDDWRSDDSDDSDKTMRVRETKL
jgi:ATP-dependent exoDNAse (exonuclease V) beta subunit